MDYHVQPRSFHERARLARVARRLERQRFGHRTDDRRRREALERWAFRALATGFVAGAIFIGMG